MCIPNRGVRFNELKYAAGLDDAWDDAVEGLSKDRVDSMAPESVALEGQQLPDLLESLYERQLAIRPDDEYLRDHARARVIKGQVEVFNFYARYLPERGRILDWGCRHAPDSCLMRARLGNELQIEGCDFEKEGAYSVFHGYAGLTYRTLKDTVRLPYDDASFDAVVASGTLEHVAMDYESLKELHRVLRLGGGLIITYLPNHWSIEEWNIRRKQSDGFHRRLYRLGEAKQLLKRAGFYPQAAGYQTNLDLMPARSSRHRLARSVRWLLPLHRINSTIGIVAQKVEVM
jgi:SAM-dependent methyltransferase